ncbi:MAG: FadR family transcriptional regulator [Lachnospiraceae bacterium]|nr:FadR family transcriptional regulator [Lachnospiraceae bacterium]
MKVNSKGDCKEEVYNQLVQGILNGDWEKGCLLPSENELAQKFQVSRVPIREAIQRLKAMGVVESQQGKGTYVKNVDSESLMRSIVPLMSFRDTKQLIDILEYRKLVEPFCIRQIIQNCTEKEIDSLEEFVVSYESMEDPASEFKYYDTYFHKRIIELTGNEFLVLINNITASAMEYYLQYTIVNMDLEWAANGHIRILEALRKRDEDQAVEVMNGHLGEVYKKLMLLYRKDES